MREDSQRIESVKILKELFWSLGTPSVPHPSILVPDAQEVAIGEAQEDTWVGRHSQGQMKVAGPYYLDGSAFNPVFVEL